MIETMYFNKGGTQLRVHCAHCKKIELFKEGGRAAAKLAGWRFLRGDVYCGEGCNAAAKRKASAT